MTRFGWLMVLSALLLIAALLGAVWLSAQRDIFVGAQPAAPSTALDPNTLAIYTNGQYGFSLFYPAADTLIDSFGTSTVAWRTNAVATGTPVVLVTDPDGKVLVGASTDAKELRTCTRPQPAEDALPARSISSTTFSTFTFDRVGTDDPERITSFRAVHEGRCFVIEITEPLREGATTTPTLTAIVESFTFARP